MAFGQFAVVMFVQVFILCALYVADPHSMRN
jgi:hypothetical protein